MSDRPVPVLSVLVPTHNYAHFIEAALESVLAQSGDETEVVIVDDGSTDQTESVVEPFLRWDRVRYRKQENRGVSAARNLAMDEARGRWFMFLDADDLLYPNCISETLAFLDRHPEVGFFFTNYDLFDESGVVEPSGVDTWKVFRTIPHEEVEPGEWVFTDSLAPYIVRHGGFMHTSGLTVHRDVAEAAGPFREGYTYGEDDEFYARAAHRTTSGYLDRVLSRKRNHEASLIHDPSRGLKNTRNLLELTEIQFGDYQGDPRMERILREKHRGLVASYCWGLFEKGEMGEGWSRLLRGLRRSPFHGALYRLAAKGLLGRRESAGRGASH